MQVVQVMYSDLNKCKNKINIRHCPPGQHQTDQKAGREASAPVPPGRLGRVGRPRRPARRRQEGRRKRTGDGHRLRRQRGIAPLPRERCRQRQVANAARTCATSAASGTPAVVGPSTDRLLRPRRTSPSLPPSHTNPAHAHKIDSVRMCFLVDFTDSNY